MRATSPPHSTSAPVRTLTLLNGAGLLGGSPCGEYPRQRGPVPGICGKPPGTGRGTAGQVTALTGALDFLVTPEGKWVFLEINPNGQWAWIEEETGLPIAAAIADALRSRN